MTIGERLDKMEQLMEELQDRLKAVREDLMRQAISAGFTKQEIEDKLNKIERGK